MARLLVELGILFFSLIVTPNHVFRVAVAFVTFCCFIAASYVLCCMHSHNTCCHKNAGIQPVTTNFFLMFLFNLLIIFVP